MSRSIILALLAPLLLVAACATEADPAATRVEAASPIAALRAVPDNAADAFTGRIEMTFTIGGTDGEVAFGGVGAFDTQARRTTLLLDLGAVDEGLDEPLEIVVDGDVTYLRLPMLASLTGEAGWLSVTADDLDQAGGAIGLPGGGTDPTQILEALRGAGAVEEVGPQDVRGVATTRYDATIDLATALDEAPADERGRIEAQLDELGATLEDLPVSVWIDAEGLARRVQIELDSGALGIAEGDGQLTMTLELFDYGEPVQIAVPALADVTAFDEVLGSLADSFTDEPA